MLNPSRPERIDYLLIGHLTLDITASGPQVGGSVAFAALTAQAMGLKVGIVTAWGEELPLGPLEGIPIINAGAEHSTTFENTYTPEGRVQTVHHIAPSLDYYHVPEAWRSAAVVHLAPVAQEISPSLARHFPEAMLCMTPQGWLREWDANGRVQTCDWPEASFTLGQADAAVISREDMQGDVSRIEALAVACPALAVTDGPRGTTLYAFGQEHFIQPPATEEVDPTGAGDIFAAAFFARYHLGGDPLEAARFANALATRSVTRRGLAGAPTPDDIYDLMMEAR